MHEMAFLALILLHLVTMTQTIVWGTEGLRCQSKVPSKPHQGSFVIESCFWQALAVGHSHACGTTVNRTGICWGDSSSNRLDMPTGKNWHVSNFGSPKPRSRQFLLLALTLSISLRCWLQRVVVEVIHVASPPRAKHIAGVTMGMGRRMCLICGIQWRNGRKPSLKKIYIYIYFYFCIRNIYTLHNEYEPSKLSYCCSCCYWLPFRCGTVSECSHWLKMK